MRPDNPLASLSAAVEAAYTCFAHYKVAGALDVCRCGVCMDDATEKALIATPLREVSVALLCEFTNSAHGAGQAEEVKYFLPRYFEAVAKGEACSWIDSLLSLDRLANWDWRTWHEDEVQVIEQFLIAFFWAVISCPDQFPNYPLNDMLIMLARVRFDVVALLKELILLGDKRDLHRVYSLWSEVRGGQLVNSFWKDSRETGTAIVTLLSSEEALRAGLAAYERSEFPELNDSLFEGLDFFLAQPTQLR